jgi:hypothetical protein
MSYVSQLVDIFTFIDNIQENNINVYLDFDNIMKLHKIAPLLYKNVPSFRTKMISNSKSYEFKDNFEEMLDFLNGRLDGTKISNIFIITNNKNINDGTKNKKLKIINNEMFYSTINSDKKISLIVDINDKKINNMLYRENIYGITLQLI